MAVEILPALLPFSRVANGRAQQLATRDSCGQRLTSWDSMAGGLCADDSFVDMPVGNAQRCILALQGPVASVFMLNVFRFSNEGLGSGAVPPPVVFSVYLGQRQGAVKLITATWSPPSFADTAQLICQHSGVLFDVAYVFAALDGAPPASDSCRVGLGVLVQEFSSGVATRFGGPNVVVAGPY